MFLSKLFTFAFSVLNFAFYTTSSSTTSLNFFKSTGTVFNLPASKLATFVFELFPLFGTLTSLLMSSLSTSAYKTIKSFLAA